MLMGLGLYDVCVKHVQYKDLYKNTVEHCNPIGQKVCVISLEQRR